MKTARTCFIATLLLALAASQAFAAGAPSIEARIGASQLYESESIAYEVHVTNGKDGVKPDLSDFKTDFDVVELGQDTYTSSFKMIINGRDVSPDSGVTTRFRYQLTPKRSGALMVPAPFIMNAGSKVSGRPFALQVIAIEKQDLVLTEIVLSKERVFPTQPFDVTLKILVKPLPNDNQDPVAILIGKSPHIKITWKDAPAGIKAQDDIPAWLGNKVANSGFVIESIMNDFGQLPSFNLLTGREKRAGLDGREINYYVYELKRRFIPQKIGSFEFGPATIKGEFVNAIAPNGRHYNVKPLLAVAPAKTVQVAVQKDAPQNFNGCIGKFELRAKTPSKDLRVGDPLALTLEFERATDSGLLESITAPDLSAMTKLAADFTVVDKNPPGQTSGNIKSYTYTLRPKKTGVVIAPITVSVFDPKTEKFDELASNSIVLNVTEAAQLRADEVISGAPISAGRSVGERGSGIFQNVADPTEIGRPALSAALYIELVTGLWLAYVVGLVGLTVYRHRAGDSALQRRMKAQTESSAQLLAAHTALKNNDATAAALGVQRALTGLIGIWNGVPPEGMTAQDASAVLEKAKASQSSRDETVRLLNSIEAAKYGAIAGLEALALVESAEKLIPTLQKEMASNERDRENS